MDIVVNGTNLSDAMEGNITALSPEALPLDAGSIFVLAVTLLAFCAPILVIFPPFPPRKTEALSQTHTKLGVEPSKPNLGDHFTTDHGSSTTAKIRSLFVYPVDSCKGIEVTRTKVIPAGLEFDRLFTFAQLKSPFPVGVDDHAKEEARQHVWELITERQFSLLATVDVELWQPDLDKLKAREEDFKSGEAFLVLRFPWRSSGMTGVWELFAAKCARGSSAEPQKEVILPMQFPSEDQIQEKAYKYESVKIGRDSHTALNVSSELPEELGLYLGVSNKLGLFRARPDMPREAFKCAPIEDDAGYQPVYPLRILSLSSVRDLESKTTKDEALRELDPRRFRANVFVSGSPAYEEDSWKRIKFRTDSSQQLDESTFHVSSRTTSFKPQNVDQDAGVRHRAEPDKSLRAHREVGQEVSMSDCLGMQMTPFFEDAESPESYLEIGMSIELLQRGEHT